MKKCRTFPENLRGHRKAPSRGMVVSIVGLPEAGKTQLAKGLARALRRVGLWPLVLDQDSKRGDMIPEIKKNVALARTISLSSFGEEAGLRKAISVAFRAVCLTNDIKASVATQEIVLFANDPYFTAVMERVWGDASRETLQEEFTLVKKPDVVLYVTTPPEVVRERGVHRVTREKVVIERMHRVFGFLAEQEHWTPIEGAPRFTVKGMVCQALGHVLSRYERHVEHAEERQPFTVPI